MDELTIIMEAVNGMTDGALYGFIFYVTYLTLTSIILFGILALVLGSCLWMDHKEYRTKTKCDFLKRNIPNE